MVSIAKERMKSISDGRPSLSVWNMGGGGLSRSMISRMSCGL